MLPSIREAVDRAIANRVNRLHVKQDHVVQELLRIALADPADAFDENGALLPLGKMPEDLRRAISGMDVEEIFAGRPSSRQRSPMHNNPTHLTGLTFNGTIPGQLAAASNHFNPRDCPLSLVTSESPMKEQRKSLCAAERRWPHRASFKCCQAHSSSTMAEKVDGHLNNES